MTSIVLKLLDSGKFDRVSHRAILPGNKIFPSNDFGPFDSVKSTLDLIVEAVKDDKMNIVRIYSMRGVGKTTLAKEKAIDEWRVTFQKLKNSKLCLFCCVY